MADLPSNSLVVGSYVLGSFAIALNSYVVFYIARMKTKSMSMACKCILYVHVSQLVYMITAFPNIWAIPIELCEFMGFVKYYCTYSNVCSSFAIDVILYGMLFNEAAKVNNSKLCNKCYWLEQFVFLLPIMTVLPFAVHLYGPVSFDGNVICSLAPNNDVSNWGKWSIAVYFAWCWGIIIIGILFMLVIIIKVAMSYSAIALQILPVYGFYPILTLAFWIPRTIGRFTDSSDSTLGITGFSQGIGYFLIFIFFQSKFFKYERDLNVDSVEASAGRESSIWQKDSDLIMSDLSSNPVLQLEACDTGEVVQLL